MWFLNLLALMGLWVNGQILLGLLPGQRARYRWDAPLRRIRVFIPAHNEERVIGQCVTSIRTSGYPLDRLDVVVLADRCTDRTAEAARAAGARVLSRHDGPPGKTAVLHYGFREIGFGDVDLVMVMDADNTLSKGALRAISAAIAAGADFCQLPIQPKGRRTVVSAGYWAMAALTHAFQRGRALLGLPIMLGGTGFAVRTDVLRQVPMNTVSLTEDLEYAWYLALAGRTGAYLDHVHTLDEKPARLWDSMRQRLRWARGGWQVLAALAPRWREIRPLWLWDLLSQSLVPFWTLAVWYYLAAGGLGWLPTYLANSTAWVAMATALGGMSWRGILDGLALPVIVATQGPILLWSLVTWRRRSWVRTPHAG